jgi:ParB family chromosome partitioning protein
LRAVFLQLLSCSDEDVQRIAAFAMAETHAVGSPCVEAAGLELKTEPANHWHADDLFFDLIRDKATPSRPWSRK